MRCFVPHVIAMSVVGAAAGAQAAVANFEEFGGPPHNLGPQAYYNGVSGASGFYSAGAWFGNAYGGGFWSGFAVSNVVDTTTPGYLNEYASWSGGGAAGSAFYAVGYVSGWQGDPLPSIRLPAGAQPQSVQITNTTYAALAMRDGEYNATPFGGADGTRPDWFRMTIAGFDEADAPLPGVVEFYLADYRFANSAQDYIVNAWTTVDLSSLAGARTLRFSLGSSDVGDWGINTPTYFALDNLVFTPEPGGLLTLGVVALTCAGRRR